jgi:hypothetical protein
MVAVFVTFQFGNDFNEAKVRKIAQEASGKFQGMPQLRSKAFTVRPEAKSATNVYLWESEDAAKAFFTDQILELVTGLYGVRPRVELAQVAALVENR